MIICPNCKNKLLKVNKSYQCINKHSFDIAKEGYINLLLNKGNSGDNKLMVKARKDFLDKGYFNNLANQILNEIINLNLKNPSILDVGCADGFYTNTISKINPNILGIDISKEAIKLAAKAYKNIEFIVANSKDLPISNSSVDIILSIFSPVFIDEVIRILKDGGILIKITPNSNHLLEMKKIVYENVYYTKEKLIEDNRLILIKSSELSYKLNVSNADLNNLITMTPYYYKTKPSDIYNLEKIERLDITFDFCISIYKKSKLINKNACFIL